MLRQRFHLLIYQGFWAPSGGGHTIRPSWYLAKNQILLSVRLFMKTDDFQLLRKETFWHDIKKGVKKPSDIKPNMRYFRVDDFATQGNIVALI